MKTVAFVAGICISVIGAMGIVAPSGLVWIARFFTTSGAFYALAAIRVAFGLVLIAVAPESRAPKALRIVGYVVVVLGVTTAVTGLVALGRAEGAIEWWVQHGSGVYRLTGLVVLVFGGFLAYACAPKRPRRRGPAVASH